MKPLKKIGHWLLFLLGGYIATYLALAICFLLPIFLFLWIYSWNTFLFLIIGSIFVIIYYWFFLAVLGGYIFLIIKHKPDYWFSNIFLLIITIFFCFSFINIFEKSINENIIMFISFKGIMFVMAIIPAYLKALYLIIIMPFLHVNYD